jgi:hypothetical protein
VRTLLLFALTALPAVALAQTYKCVDAQKRITYSNTACEKQGLKDAGPVADRIMTVPATEMPKPAPRKEPAKSPRAAEDADAGKGAPMKPVVPQTEKLAK